MKINGFKGITFTLMVKYIEFIQDMLKMILEAIIRTFI